MSNVRRRMLVVLFALLVSMLVPATARPAAAAGGIVATLTMHSEPGDYIGQGLDYYYDTSIGAFSARVSMRNGMPDFVEFAYVEPGHTHWWYPTFATNQLGHPLEPGSYEDAQRAPFADAGHAGLDISGDGRGCNELSGRFTIEESAFEIVNGQAYVTRFVATFEQHCESAGAPALTGRIEYIDSSDSEPPSTTATVSGPLGTNGWYTGATTVTLETSGGLTMYQLDNGAFTQYTAPVVVTGDGRHSLSYWSEDDYGNQEMQKAIRIPIDATAPLINATSSLQRSTDRKSTSVMATVTGSISDPTSGVDTESAQYRVVDEYGAVQPAGVILVTSTGEFSFSVLLEGPRSNDRDGRQYQIELSGQDRAGNTATKTIPVLVTAK